MPKNMHHPEFVPHPLLSNGHLMTIVPALWPRKFSAAVRSGVRKIVEVEPGVKILTWHHMQPSPMGKPTIILVHGLEGSADSSGVCGTTQKAYMHGMNVVRMNLRNCGGTHNLTPTLYDSGMSEDVISLVRQLREKDKHNPIFVAGWSMGGNIVLKAAAELKKDGPSLLSGVCAISPPLDLSTSMLALERGFNQLYERHFLQNMKSDLREKAKLFPELYDPRYLRRIKKMRQFDDHYTAPIGGYGTAENYYHAASTLPILGQICVPTLIIHAQDDPLIPFAPFQSPNLKTPYIRLLAPKHGGHVGFVHKDNEAAPHFDRFWAENRVVNFSQQVMKNISAG
jgi:predicted alpha/beta-fold hydrolase